MLPDARSFLRSSTPLRSWLLPNLRLMDRKIGRPMVGGAVAKKPSRDHRAFAFSPTWWRVQRKEHSTTIGALTFVQEGWG